MTLEIFRQAYQRDAANVTFGQKYNSASLSAGTPTPWYELGPRNGKSCVLGTWVQAIYVLTATGPATPVAGSDALSPIFDNGGRVDIGAGPGASSRASNLTRGFIEFVQAVTTDQSPGIAALPTFASAGTATVTVNFFVPIGGTAAALAITLPAAITSSYASGVTVAYTSIECDILSSNFTGVCAFRETKTASLGTGFQSILQYLPKDVAPDAAFMNAETSTTITQVLIQTIDQVVLINSSATNALEAAAAAIAPIAGVTYTTSAGFVLSLNQKQFLDWSMNFASAAVHYVGFVQVLGGETVLPNQTPQPTSATPAVQQTGSVTPSGGVTAGRGTTGKGGGGSSVARGGRYVYKSSK